MYKAENTTHIPTQVSNATVTNQLANQPTGTIISSNKQMNMYHYQ
jgi:hypothetical protein